MIRGGIIKCLFNSLLTANTHLSPSLLYILQTYVCGGCVSKFDRPEIGNPEKEKFEEEEEEEEENICISTHRNQKKQNED